MEAKKAAKHHPHPVRRTITIIFLVIGILYNIGYILWQIRGRALLLAIFKIVINLIPVALLYKHLLKLGGRWVESDDRRG